MWEYNLSIDKINLIGENLTLDKEVVHNNPDEAIVTKSNYSFINFVRFISMIGVVWAHIRFMPDNLNTEQFLAHLPNFMKMEYIFFMQFFKFGVICFFLISGYLLGDKIQSSEPYQYFKRRFNVTAKPYIVVVLIILVAESISFFLVHGNRSGTEFYALMKYLVLDGALWYLPNYLISLTVLLCCTKYIHKIWFGGILFLATLIYTALTVYNPAYEVSHTSAIFGFVFYLWLGVYVRQHNLINQIYKIKINWLILITLSLFVLSSIESYELLEKNNTQYFNVLRVMNQLYSISMFCLLVKISQRGITFNFFNPRAETFGIYLYHSIFIIFFLPRMHSLLMKYLQVDIYNMSNYLLLFLLYFLVCYLFTVFLVRFLIKYKLGYLSLNQHS